MLTIIDSAALLARATQRPGRLALLRTLGFDAPAGQLDSAARERLALNDLVVRADIAAGPGTLRALMLHARAGTPLRDALGQAARRVAARAPELLWLVLAHGPGNEVGIAIPAPGGLDPTGALLIDCRHVRPGDAESFATLASAVSASDLDTHLRWREVLGRDTLTRRFYRDLESAVQQLAEGAVGQAPPDVRSALALRLVSRLLFLAFLEAKGWLDEDRAFLSRQVVARGAALHRTLLEPLFFGTLNTPHARRAAATRAFGRVPFLNGGLFTRDALEKAHRSLRFADDDIARVVETLLGRYRVTAQEGSPEFAEAAVDPEMLGRAFESLMATDERRNTGAFYTPPSLIAHVFDQALDAAVPDTARGALDEARTGRVADADDARRLREWLTGLRIVDPACGTGAFLVHALTALSRLLAAAHDERPEHQRRRDLLARSIFGVDINPTAVWLCELRLWLAVVVDLPERDPLHVPPLPNLDRNIRCADALSGPAFDAPGGDTEADEVGKADSVGVIGDAGVATLRARYARATGVRKRALQRQLDRAERAVAIAQVQGRLTANGERRRDLLCALRGRDLFGRRRVATATERAALDQWRKQATALRRALAALRAGGAIPFGFATHFADVARQGGFDLVIGNPPWVRLHRIPPGDRERLRAGYAAFRNAAWRAGAAAGGALTGFAMQADLAALFTERAMQLARPGGSAALLLPAKLFRSLAGGGVRSMLAQAATLVALEDHSEGRAVFDAAVYPAILVARRHPKSNVQGPMSSVQRPMSNIRHSTSDDGRRTRNAGGPTAAADQSVRCAVVRRDTIIHWRAPHAALPLDTTEGAPWMLLPPPARTAFDALVAQGVPLAESPFGRPLLGVKSGCNDAFIVRPDDGWQARAEFGACDISAGERRGTIERAMLRPVLRGEALAPFHAPMTDDAIVWTHDADGRALATLPPRAARWLSHWRITLERRADARTRDRWWSLFRLEASVPRWRVVWGDVGRTPRAVVLAPDDPTIALNSCYVLAAPTVDDADAMAAWLNAPLANTWLAPIAEPARGGYRRYLGWTMARLPIPADWPRACRILAPLGTSARLGRVPTDAELNAAALRAFGVTAAQMEPLFTWMHS